MGIKERSEDLPHKIEKYDRYIFESYQVVCSSYIHIYVSITLKVVFNSSLERVILGGKDCDNM